jgi:hypothetical protein
MALVKPFGWTTPYILFSTHYSTSMAFESVLRIRIGIRIRSDPDLFGRIRIRKSWTGFGSGRLGPDPDPDPGLNKWPNINFFGVWKSRKYFRKPCSLTFWFMNILFRTCFCQKKFPEKTWIKISWGQDQNVSKSGSGSGQKSSGSATLLGLVLLERVLERGVPTLAQHKSTDSWNRYHSEDVWNAMCQHSHYTWVRNPGIGNYQLIDEESTRGKGFHRELPAYLLGFRPVRSKFAENPSNGNNSRISSSKSYILTIPTIFKI